jgi:recombination protein RecA
MSIKFDPDSFFDSMAKALPEHDKSPANNLCLSTGFLPLNHAISGRYRDGGLPQGRIVEIFGPESSGKTAISNEVMIAAQKAGGVPAFHDHERSFDFKLAEGRGLDTRRGRFLFAQPRTFEDSLTACIENATKIRDAGLPMDRPLAWVFDSLASMIPQSQIAKGKDMLKLGMADQTALARATSLNFKTLAMWAEELNICMIFLNQIRQKPGVIYGDPNTTPGGNAPKYYASVRIQLGAQRLMKGTGDDKVMTGSLVTARCIKNKVYRPWMRAKWRFEFAEDGTGHFDNVGSTLDVLTDAGLIERHGSFLIWDGKKYHRDPLVRMLEADSKGLTTLEDMLIAGGVGAEVGAADDVLGADEESADA